MLRHTLLIILRNIKRNKSSFLINLVGLSIGLASAILIFLWVADELNVDKGFANEERIYQVLKHSYLEDGIETGSVTPDMLAESLIEDFPEIEYAAAVIDPSWFSFTLKVDEKNYKTRGQFAGENYFKIFSFDLLHGDPDQVLASPNSIVLSEELAKKIFNSTENIIGRTVEWELLSHKFHAVVSGVLKGLPKNSTAQFDFALSFQGWLDLCKKINRRIQWGNNAPYTYLMLKKGANVNALNQKLDGYLKSKNEHLISTLFVRPFADAYLYDKYENGVQAGGRIEYVKLFSIIAAFIILIACINFMNLSTAKAARRMKEVGIKKTVGAQRKTLIMQYMGESIFMAFVSLLVAVLIVEIFLPYFNEITGKHLALNFTPAVVLSLLAITLFTGIIAGSYPALYMSKFNPALILKGKIKGSASEFWTRKGLVVFQFTLSIILIVSVLVVYKQIEFIQMKNLGYDKDNIIYFDKEGNLTENRETFLSELRKVPGVVNASASGSNFIGSSNSVVGIKWDGYNPDEHVQFEVVDADYNLIETMGFKLKEGRAYSREFGSEDTKVIFNERAIQVMGLEDPIGKKIDVWGKEKEIIGVIEDFNYESLHESINPLFFMFDPEHTLNVFVKVKAGMESEVLAKVKEVYDEFNPGYTFEYKFLDQDYQAQYEAEKRVGILSRYFAGIAVIISCLGLFGLAAYTAERRRKEIGIRKALGSGELRIVYLLSSDFTKTIIISILIAMPVSFVMVRSWLNSFAYKIDLEAWYFITAGLLALLMTWITVGVHAVKAARTNPVKSLKYE